MSRQVIFGRNGRKGHPLAGPHALIILGIDNIGVLEDLLGEHLGDEIIDAVEVCIAPALPSQATMWRAEHRRIRYS